MKYTHSARVVSNEKLAPAHFRMTLAAPAIAEKYQPGNFVTVRVGDGLVPLLRRPFSISRSDGKENIEIVYRVVGEGTGMLAAAKPGRTFDLTGPLGNSFTVDESLENHVIVAGGIGIAPFPGLIDVLLGLGLNVVLVYGASCEDELVLRGELETSGVKFIMCTDDGSCGGRGLVTDFAEKYIDDKSCVYACGPLKMFTSLFDACRTGKSKWQFSFEARMVCGIGFCNGCAVPVKDSGNRRVYRKVCTEGPVFKSGDCELLFE